MKFKISSILVSFTFSMVGMTALAESPSSGIRRPVAPSAEKTAEGKKVEMCSECGKPEIECNCHKEKEGKKGDHKSKEDRDDHQGH